MIHDFFTIAELGFWTVKQIRIYPIVQNKKKASLVKGRGTIVDGGGIGNPPVAFSDSPLYTRGPFTLFVKLEFVILLVFLLSLSLDKTLSH